MLRIFQNSSASGVKSYFKAADYYTEGQELEGRWRGKGAARLGLEGSITADAWNALCDNINPETGRALTVRQREGRRVGYDFNFHVPKSVSLYYGLTQDERVLDTFRVAVDETMCELEADAQTRVRSGSRNEDRTTGNLVWGEFVHTTARPVDGIPDPHLHAHCFAFNATWDDREQRWKAGQFAGIKRDAVYYEVLFHARLALGLERLGFDIARNRKRWELGAVARTTLEKFSRRTALIEARARAEGIVAPEKKAELGSRTREKKNKKLTLPELRGVWGSWLTSDEADAIGALAQRPERTKEHDVEPAAEACVDAALRHCLERQAVVPERRLLAEALKRGYGSTSPEAVRRALEARDVISADKNGERVLTTAEVLAEERRMLAFARDGRGTCPALGSTPHVFARDWLNAGQRRAVEQLLQSRDRVMLLRGGAGTGKTSMMQETVEAIEAGGHEVLPFAPSAEASRGVLRSEGFADADTVARLLVDEDLQARARGQVLWIDEAGLLGTRTVAEVFDLADRIDARVVLSGDRGQHGSVERGATLRLLEQEAGLVPAELKDIQRQTGDYKHAVAELSAGRTASGFGELDKLGWVKEARQGERESLVARDYVSAIEDGKTVLVIAPTHREGDLVTDAIRHELQAAGKLGADARAVPMLVNANLTEAERGDAINFRRGDVLVFHQNAKGHTRGERLRVTGDALPLDQAARFQLFHQRMFSVAPGERLRITRNGTTADGKHRLNNGQTVTVKRFDGAGNLVLANGWTIARDYGHLAYGYVSTSHASQGKTVDRVLIAQGEMSERASSQEQFYVSVSRGRERATIYTDDKAALLEAVSRRDDRLAATDLVAMRDRVAITREQRNIASSREGLGRPRRVDREVSLER